jgi:hypothetical protein
MKKCVFCVLRVLNYMHLALGVTRTCLLALCALNALRHTFKPH